MEVQFLLGYLKRVQELYCQFDRDPGALQELLHYIELSKDEHTSNPIGQEFFKGEYAFYNSHYERALKHYLQCKGLYHYEFFCYRASAFVSKAQGQCDKSLSFINKALEIFSEDPSCLNIKKELQQSSHSLVQPRESLGLPQELPGRLAISESEIKELVGIFARPHANSELFADERNQTSRLNGPNGDFFSFNINESTSFYPEEDTHATLFENIEGEHEALAHEIQSYKSLQSEIIGRYIEQGKKRHQLPDNCLYVLQGWEEGSQSNSLGNSIKEHLSNLLNESGPKLSGGIFLRWQGKGIAINPGRNFLKNFHAMGWHLYDLHHVIVTHEFTDGYAYIKEIYELAHRLNKANDHFHLIHYYLHQKAFQTLNGILKPHCKQERNTVHNLELFIDSDAEKMELSENILLHYFSASSSSKSHPSLAAALGIRLELLNENATTNLGYVTKMPWQPSLCDHLAQCDILLAGVGETNNTDYHKISYLDLHLGYYGVFSLCEKLHPKLLLCLDFDGRQGDLRLELVKKMRHELLEQHTEYPFSTVLPAEKGLIVNIQKLKVKCSLSGKLTDPQKIRVVRTAAIFSPLLYLSPSNYL